MQVGAHTKRTPQLSHYEHLFFPTPAPVLSWREPLSAYIKLRGGLYVSWSLAMYWCHSCHQRSAGLESRAGCCAKETAKVKEIIEI